MVFLTAQGEADLNLLPRRDIDFIEEKEVSPNDIVQWNDFVIGSRAVGDLILSCSLLKSLSTYEDLWRTIQNIIKNDQSTSRMIITLEPLFECRSHDAQRIETLLKLLVNYKQHHVFDGWESLSMEEKSDLMDEIITRKAFEHIDRFRQIMTKAAIDIDKIAPADQMDSVVKFPFCSNEYFQCDQVGKQMLMKGKVAFVLVAGGLGERLGSSQIKISLPTESLTGTTFLEMFLLHLVSFSLSSPPPLCIMTSDDTHQRTVELLTKLGVNFSEHINMNTVNTPTSGRSDYRVTLVKQDTVVCFSNRDGQLALKSPGKLLLKPHGHGDVHPLVHKACLEEWRTRGIEYIVFFQDTNPNCFRVFPSVLGVVQQLSLDCAMACVPRIPGSATGCIAHNVTTNTLENFEYNLMNAVFEKNPELDDKFTLGNTNQLVLRLSNYSILDPYMPEFCNPKFKPGSATNFASPARLECLMQDIMRFYPLKSARAVLFYDSPNNNTKTHVLYAPAKNSLKVAQAAWNAGTTDGSPASSEAAIYSANCNLMASLGCTIHTYTDRGVTFGSDGSMQICPLYPSVVFDPRVLPYWSEASTVFVNPKDVHIGENASLELRGPGKIIIRKLHLEGSLIVWAKSRNTVIELTDVTVRNSGRTVSSVEGDARLRIYHAADATIIDCDLEGMFPIAI